MPRSRWGWIRTGTSRICLKWWLRVRVGSGLAEPHEVLDAGNSGTTIRSLAGDRGRLPGCRSSPGTRPSGDARCFGSSSPCGRWAPRSTAGPAATSPPLAIRGGRADRHEARLDGCERPGEDGPAAGRARRRGDDRGHRARAEPRPHREDARVRLVCPVESARPRVAVVPGRDPARGRPEGPRRRLVGPVPRRGGSDGRGSDLEIK